jgi:hypothetical protein
MPRQVSWGTPSRSEHYLRPRKAYRLIMLALLAGGVLAFLLLVFHLVGMRGAVAPGSVISAHAPVESRCEECHAPRSGASNLRCQRCHDAAGAGRLSNGSHVLFGSGNPRKAAAAPDLYCAGCHVEHRGREAKLSLVDDLQCVRCHFRGLGGHPEFAVLRRKSLEVPGLKYPHDCHVRELAKKGSCKELSFDPGPVASAATCSRCHEPAQAGRDLVPISFDKHCASCHLKDGSVGSMDPVPQEDALPPEAIRGLGIQADWLGRGDAFDTGRGKIAKSMLRHKDEWVVFNMWKLRRELDPEGFAKERGLLLARASQLRRRLVLAVPLAGLDLDGLKARQAAVRLEIRGLERRMADQSKGVDPAAGLARLDEVLAAASAAGSDEARSGAEALQARAAELRTKPIPTAALPADAYDQRRKELLSAVDAIEAAAPALKLRTEDLRRRILAVGPGDSGAALLTRVRDQRQLDLRRVQDEIELRQAGMAPPRPSLLAGDQGRLRTALASVEEQIRRMSEGPAAPQSLSPEERERKKGSLEALLSACAKCHPTASGSLPRVSAARPVLVRSTFVHAPHLLQADCSRCHAGVEKSKLSSDLNFKGIASCRECHGFGRARQDCQSCHRYHPPVTP